MILNIWKWMGVIMKKIIFLLMLIMNVFIFAEKLHTDGKNNLNKLVGNWGNSADDLVSIRLKNNKWYFGSYCPDCQELSGYNNGMVWDIIQNYKNGVFIVKNFYKIPSKRDKNFYFAYDTKYKKLVELDSQLNIIGIIHKR